MEDADFLGHFWDLGSSDAGKRRRATSALTEALARAECCGTELLPPAENIDDKVFHYKLPQAVHGKAAASFLQTLEYVTHRLIHGLSSSREGVRLGFSALLDLILHKYIHLLPLASIVEAIHTTTSAKCLLGEVKDFHLGRIFGYSIVQRTQFFTTCKCLPLADTVVKDLTQVLENKVYMRDGAVQALAPILIDLEKLSPGIWIKQWRSKFNIAHEWKLVIPNDKVKPPYGYLALCLILYRRNAMECRSKELIKYLPSWLEILLAPSTILSFHPKLPGAWFDLFTFIIEQSDSDVTNKLFTMIFKRLNEEGSPCSFTNSTKTTDESLKSSAQRTWNYFFVMLELLVVLKIKASCTKATVNVNRWLSLFWDNSHRFIQQLLFHMRAFNSPLRNAAAGVLTLLIQITNGYLQEPTKKIGRGKDMRDSEISVVSVGIYERVVLEGIDPSTLIRSKFIAGQETWANALKAFKQEMLRKQDPQLMARIVELCVSPMEEKEVESLLMDFEQFVEDTNLTADWFWRFEVAIQIIFFQQKNLKAAARLLSKAIATLFASPSDTGSPKIISIGSDSTFIGACLIPGTEQERQLNNRRIMTRIGPALSSLLISAARIVTRTSETEQTKDFHSEFLRPLLILMNSLLGDAQPLLTYKKVIANLKASAQNGVKANGIEQQVTTQQVTHQLATTHKLREKEIEICLSFGVLAHRALKKTAAISSSVASEINQGLICLTVLLIQPLLTAVDDDASIDRRATIDLLSQIATVLIEVNEKPSDSVYSAAMEEFIGVLSPIMLPIDSAIESTALSVSRAMVLSVLSFLWKAQAKYAQADCISSLITRLLGEQGEELSEVGQDEPDNIESSEGPTSDEQESEDDSESEPDLTIKDESSNEMEDESSNEIEDDKDATLEGSDLATFLASDGGDLEPQEGMIPSPFDTNLKLKRQTAMRHRRVIEIQTQHRGLDLLHVAIQNLKNPLPQNLLDWASQLFKAFVALSSRLSRKNATQSQKHNRIIIGSLEVSQRKLELSLSQLTNKLIASLASSTEISDDEFDAKSLSNLTAVLLENCQRSIRCEPIGASLVLCSLRIEELMMKNCSAQLDDLGVSSGLLITDGIISLLQKWISRSHSPITEKFFRVLMALATRHFVGRIPLGLLILPLAILAPSACKPFVSREAIAIEAEFLSSISTCPSCLAVNPAHAIVDHARQWWLSQVKSSKIPLKEFELELINSQKTIGEKIYLGQCLVTMRAAMEEIALVRQSSIFDKAQPDVPIENTNDNQRRLQRNQKLVFEQQLGLALGRVVAAISRLPNMDVLKESVEAAVKLSLSCRRRRRNRQKDKKKIKQTQV